MIGVVVTWRLVAVDIAAVATRAIVTASTIFAIIAVAEVTGSVTIVKPV